MECQEVGEYALSPLAAFLELKQSDAIALQERFAKKPLTIQVALHMVQKKKRRN
ncbi:MAG: hypothetical protein LBD15_01015 [Holosporales bacterium]|nr:hypothetical protein [Holosporales bacterium]